MRTHAPAGRRRAHGRRARRRSGAARHRLERCSTATSACAHFFGLHALQVLPLLALTAAAPRERQRRGSAGRQRRRSYARSSALLSWQALRGQSLIHPDALTAAPFRRGPSCAGSGGLPCGVRPCIGIHAARDCEVRMTPEQSFSVLNLVHWSRGFCSRCCPRHAGSPTSSRRRRAGHAGGRLPALIAANWRGSAAASPRLPMWRRSSAIRGCCWPAGCTTWRSTCDRRWEVRDARSRGIHHWLVVPCLILTFLFGPAGWLLYMAMRSPARGQAKPRTCRSGARHQRK